MERAPFHAEIAEGPDGGGAWWLRTEDDVRIRMGAWPLEGARGTVLMMPGRTEYVEKYAPAAGEFAARGYASVTVDWRGQGLADRILPDRTIGHVLRFADYQRDVRAMVAAADALALPRPFHLLGHSMGGAIGLRALIEGLEVGAAAFSAPMWGIVISPVMRPIAWAVTGAAGPIGLGHRFAPGTEPQTYVLAAGFEGNKLTGDREMYEFMQRQLRAVPDLALGGPSLSWLHEALRECRALRAMRYPAIPCYCAVGARERIIDTVAVASVMARWPGGVCETYEGAEHELLMEGPAYRRLFYDAAARTFDGLPFERAAGAAAC